MPKSNQDIRHLIRLSDDALLDMRLCDLPLRIQETNLQDRVEQLYDELESRGLKFRTHVWLSDDWYSPDGKETAAGSGGRDTRVVHEDPSTRSGACSGYGIPVKTEEEIPGAFWESFATLPQILPART